MSYRIAHVRFSKGGQTYPVNCHRSDLAPADLVVVEMHDRTPRQKIAEVEGVEFLNWRCKNTIVCKQSEFRANGRGSYRIERETEPLVIETIKGLIDRLRHLGWQNANVSRHVYMHVCVKRFELSAAAIGIRRNGIDFQVYDDEWELDAVDGPKRFPDGQRNLVRHNFYASELDLLEFCKEFAINAHHPFHDLKKYFQPLGKKQPRPAREIDGLQDIRDAIGDAMTDTEREAFY